jgi:hypothetical protein
VTSGILSTVNGAVLNTGGQAVGLIVNNNENITGRLGVYGKDAATGYPNGWSGGIHTWDLYAEGSVGSGQNGALNAYLTNNGDVWSDSTIGAGASPGTYAAYMNAGGTVSAQKFCLNGTCITTWKP